MLALAKEAVQLAANGSRLDLVAHFAARVAQLAETEVSVYSHCIDMIKLAPGWIGFATDADKEVHDKATAEVERLEREIDAYLTTATSTASALQDKRVQASVLLAKARVIFARYLRLKGEYLKESFRARLWKYEVMRHPVLEYVLLLGNGDGPRLNRLFGECVRCQLEAAVLYDAIDDPGAASAYLNLTNDLRTVHRCRAARKYLRLARESANKHNDQRVLRRLEALEKSINVKNRDVPHYEKGETRDLDTL